MAHPDGAGGRADEHAVLPGSPGPGGSRAQAAPHTPANQGSEEQLMTVTVSPMHARNSHHVKLSDGITDVGLILCDPGGETAKSPPRSSISSDPVVRSSIKMYSGEQRHSDLEPPRTDTAQDD